MKKIKELKWRLDDIVTMEKFDKLEKEIKKEVGRAGGWIEKLKPEMSGKDFREMVDWWQGLEEMISRLMYRPYLMETTDSKDQQAKLLKAKASDITLFYGRKLRPMAHWLKGKNVDGLKRLDDENAKRLFTAVADLKCVFVHGRKAAKYTLEQREEDIISNKDTYGLETVMDLRNLIETEMVYDFCPKGGRRRKIGTREELLVMVHSEKAEKREAAYRALLTEHKKHIDKLFLIYQSVVKNWSYEAKLRGYKSPIAMRNFANQVPDEAVETLLRVCTEEREVFGSFFELKAREMGVKKLNRFDLYCPRKGKEKRYGFGEAKRLVLETMYDFSKRWGRAGEKIFNEGHIDSHPRVNKRGGAFCATVGPTVTPYVLLNHTKTLNSVYALAHELGHGVHSLYANKHRILAQGAGLPLAETASTMTEMLLFEKLLTEEQDGDIKKTMLWKKMGDAFAAILRQNYFTKFEVEAHERFSKGLTVEELGGLWMKGLREQFGNSVEIDPIFAYEWGYVSHLFDNPFYCYAYSFGELLSLSLFGRYKKEGKSFIPEIERILEAGGSEEPDKVLKRVGVDMRSEEFWRQGFEVIKGWQEKLEEKN